MWNASGIEFSGQVYRVAGHVKTRSERRECIGKVGFVIPAIVDELIDRCIDVAIGNLIEHSADQVPVGTELVLHPKLSNPGLQIHARKGLAIAAHSRIWRVLR